MLDAIALETLAEQGFLPETVPPKGARVLIRRNGNLSTGGTATDVTDVVHPQVAARAVEAARMVGLDVAGIDVLAQDIGRPLEEQGGAVIEVNAGPGLRMHLHPSQGQPRPVGEAIVDLMFAPGETGRIPIVAVAGGGGHRTTSRLVAHILEGTGSSVGLADADGLIIAGRRIESDAWNNQPIGKQSVSSFSLGLMGSVPIFNRNQGEICRAETNVAQTRAALAAIEREAVAEVEDALVEYHASREAVERIENAILPASERLRTIAYQKHQAGRSGTVEYARAQRSRPPVSRYAHSAPAEYAATEHGGRAPLVAIGQACQGRRRRLTSRYPAVQPALAQVSPCRSLAATSSKVPSPPASHCRPPICCWPRRPKGGIAPP
ncbi:MAG TPA: TolC family protein [Pirellulales bacterium]|nr:TolC family protein [Pirellulales bacterium]